MGCVVSKGDKFLPTPSARRATPNSTLYNFFILFLPTPSARRAMPKGGAFLLYQIISTHALREEGDAI